MERRLGRQNQCLDGEVADLRSCVYFTADQTISAGAQVSVARALYIMLHNLFVCTGLYGVVSHGDAPAAHAHQHTAAKQCW
jgi:hypothetical protein